MQGRRFAALVGACLAALLLVAFGGASDPATAADGPTTNAIVAAADVAVGSDRIVAPVDADPFLHRTVHSPAPAHPSTVGDPDVEAGCPAATDDLQVDAYADVAERYTEVVPDDLSTGGRYPATATGAVQGVEPHRVAAILTDGTWIPD